MKRRLFLHGAAALALAGTLGFRVCAAIAAPGGSSTAAAPYLTTEIPQAQLAGSGPFRYFGMHIYDAQLWVGAGGYRPGAPRATPFALELRYARALNGRKIAGASADEIKTLGIGTAAQRADWLVRMEKLFPDVQEGTRITGVFLPAHGARFYRDGKSLGEIADPEFAAAFFAIWLDPKTTAPALRSALLADAAPR